MEKKRILIVDDDEDFCEILCEILSEAGYICHHRLNGAEALRYMGEEYTRSSRDHPGNPPHLPDLILLDWLMPEMDGFGFMSMLLSNPKYRHVQVVIISNAPLDLEDMALSWVAHIPKVHLSVPALLELVARKTR